MRDAEEVFQLIESRDLVSYNTLIAGFATHGNGIEVVDLLRKMKKENIESERITYILGS